MRTAGVQGDGGESDDGKVSKSRLRKPIIVIGLITAVAALALGVYFTVRFMQDQADVQAELACIEADPMPQISDTPAEKLENPIDFDELIAQNPDIYAWLYVPGTNVNQPVLQSAVDDLYYLDHDRTGAPSSVGAVFSQSMNALDFSDPVTVLYGHDVDEPSLMFRSLHNFEDADFFENNREIYIYQPDRVLVYEVVAAYEYDDRHILNSFDFSDPAVLQSYYDSVLAPTSLTSNVRAGASLDASKDKILQLSTCMLDEFHGSHRYIVTGVLRDEQ